MNTEDEIAVVTEPTRRESFSKRLRAALEGIEVGPDKALQIYTKEDRQTITNAVIAVKKKTGYNLKTHMVQRRDDTGKMVIEIERLEA